MLPSVICEDTTTATEKVTAAVRLPNCLYTLGENQAFLIKAICLICSTQVFCEGTMMESTNYRLKFINDVKINTNFGKKNSAAPTHRCLVFKVFAPYYSLFTFHYSLFTIHYNIAIPAALYGSSFASLGDVVIIALKAVEGQI